MNVPTLLGHPSITWVPVAAFLLRVLMRICWDLYFSRCTPSVRRDLIQLERVRRGRRRPAGPRPISTGDQAQAHDLHGGNLQ